jgi:hypothetical protein
MAFGNAFRTTVLVADGTRIAAKTDGGDTEPPPYVGLLAVVAPVEVLWDTLPAPSNAATPYKYPVAAERPVSTYEREVVVAILTPFLYIRYPASPLDKPTPVPESVELAHESDMDVGERTDADKFVGMEGGVVSGMAFTVKTNVEVA